MKKPKVCECCGHPLAENGNEIMLALTPLQRRFYDMVQRAGTAGLTTEAIRERLYLDAPDGGPDSCNIVHVMARQMNIRLEKFGVEVRGTPGVQGGHYKVQPINWNRRIVQAKQTAKRGRDSNASHR